MLLKEKLDMLREKLEMLVWLMLVWMLTFHRRLALSDQLNRLLPPVLGPDI